MAIVNIKKIAGNSISDMESLDRFLHTEEDCMLMRKQVEDISPALVVCCGTYEQAKKIFNITCEQ